MHIPLPFATSRGFRTLGIWDGGSNPVTVFLIIPFLGLGGIRIRDGQRLIIKPVFRFLGLLIRDLVRSILVPVIGL